MSQNGPGAAQLQEMLTSLRAECGHSTNVAFGLQERQAFVYTLNRVQMDLWESFDWPFLQGHAQVSLAANTFLYPFPATMRFEDVNKVEWWDGANQTYELTYGVGVEQYAVFNSLASPPATSSPPVRWRTTAGLAGLLEVWPCPNGSVAGGELFLTGSLMPTAMVNDSDLSTLPWRIIVLSAAAELLSAEKDPTAQVKAQAAAALIRRFKVRQGTHKRGIIPLGGHPNRLAPRVGLDFIPNGYGSGPSRS